jgi:hypothetical protein
MVWLMVWLQDFQRNEGIDLRKDRQALQRLTGEWVPVSTCMQQNHRRALVEDGVCLTWAASWEDGADDLITLHFKWLHPSCRGR